MRLIEEHGLAGSDIIALAKDQLRAEGVSAAELDSKAIELIVEKHYCTYDDIYKILSEEFSIPLVSLDGISIRDEVKALLPDDIVRKHHILPLDISNGQLEAAISDPMDMDSVDTVSRLVGMPIDLRLAPAHLLDEAIDAQYGLKGEFNSILESAETNGLQMDTGAASEEDAPIVKYVQSLITEAVKRRASDIHLEPLEKRFRVRYRIDGVLVEVENPPKRLQPSIISRLKLMADMSIAEKRVPLDGRIQITYNQKDIDLRVSSLPTVYGESIVMRILDKEGLRLGLPELGFFSDDQSTFERVVGMPDGIFLVTGPTGSGKSTTLYSALNYLNHPDRKIITVEDPVEYQMTGINQVQVRREVGMTFAAALRSMLRQAPNIIMIGEIRDLETAEIAINASLTGHMVFSTLHTNDAPSAVTRLVDIGVKPFLVSASLRAALAQRLVRKNCAACKEAYTPDARVLQAIGINEIEAQGMNFMHGVGCPKCNGIGYKGRMGIFEIFIINEELQQMIYEGRTLVELRTKARELGMRNMREDGIRKVASGLTTADEVLKVTMNDL